MLSRNVCLYWIKIIVETLRRSRRGSGDDDDDGNEMDEEDHTDTETATVLEYQLDNLIIRMGGVELESSLHYGLHLSQEI